MITLSDTLVMDMFVFTQWKGKAWLLSGCAMICINHITAFTEMLITGRELLKTTYMQETNAEMAFTCLAPIESIHALHINSMVLGIQL